MLDKETRLDYSIVIWKAFEKGFKQATDTWGDELPEISQKTYAATMQKFDDWAAEAQKTAETV